jgi:catechol 2,3-dioxygenase-like lactoylglutathione lyase family enzyme
MDARLTMVTLGVDDFKRALKFYRDGLGWRPWKGSTKDWTLFPLAGGIGLALWPRRLLSRDAGVKHCTGYGGVTLAHNVATRAAVDRLLARAAKSGGKLLKKGVEKTWGGYSGYFADPDGHPWEVAWNPQLTPGGRLSLE